MENRLINLIVIVSLFSSCTTLKYLPVDLKGIYIQKGNKNIQLILNKGTFLYVNTYNQVHAPLYNCGDTLAYGYWTIDNGHNLLILNSPEELNTSYLYMDVKEKTELNNDSLYFFIYNPIEDHYKKYNEKYRELFYSISITSNNPGFDTWIAAKKFDKNPIRLLKPQNSIESFSINIMPKHDISVRHVGIREIYTLGYKIINPNSNVFTIKLPQLGYNYINYLRLEEDYVKIKNKNSLIWNGKEYIKN